MERSAKPVVPGVVLNFVSPKSGPELAPTAPFPRLHESVAPLRTFC